MFSWGQLGLTTQSIHIPERLLTPAGFTVQLQQHVYEHTALSAYLVTFGEVTFAVGGNSSVLPMILHHWAWRMGDREREGGRERGREGVREGREREDGWWREGGREGERGEGKKLSF